MVITKGNQERIEAISVESLEAFSKVAEAAAARLAEASSASGAAVFASINTFTSTRLQTHKKD